jgi:hypothetical protein
MIGRLKWVDDSRLAPGGLIEVSARHGRTTESIFEGEIVEIEPQFEAEGLKVTVRAFDRLHRLGRGRHTRTFLNVTDSDVITQLAERSRFAGADRRHDAGASIPGSVEPDEP